MQAQAPTLGPGRLVCIDGPTGAGKTTLADAVAAGSPGATVLHTDLMLAGWRGLDGLSSTLDLLLRPLAEGRASRWRKWDWDASGWAGWRPVAPVELLVLEGVGSAPRNIADLVTTTVWVDGPENLRRQRWWDREGQATIGYRDQWVADESVVHAREDTRSRADVLVDGTA